MAETPEKRTWQLRLSPDNNLWISCIVNAHVVEAMNLPLVNVEIPLTRKFMADFNALQAQADRESRLVEALKAARRMLGKDTAGNYYPSHVTESSDELFAIGQAIDDALLSEAEGKHG